MSLKKIEQVKKDRGFKLSDIIIYGTVVLIVAVLFIVVFTALDTDPLSGVKIIIKSQKIFEYEFGEAPQYSEDVKEIDGKKISVSVVEDEKGITVTITSEGDKNVVYIDKQKKTAKMTEANCRGRHCTYFFMDDNSDIIFCDPRGIKIEPLKRDLNDPNIKI